MATIYFIRHSKSQKVNNIINSDNLQVQNEKFILSIEGEKIAEKKLNIDELKNIDYLISSNYVRAISTAKYIAENNNIDINIIESFGERKFGVGSWDELPSDFYERQFNDKNYKIDNGESQKEVRTRMTKALNNVLENHKDERVAIVTHSTSLLYLLLNWCEVKNKNIYFDNELVGPVQIENCDIFKLSFDENKNLKDIVKI